jgi:hypothetical protein
VKTALHVSAKYLAEMNDSAAGAFSTNFHDSRIWNAHLSKPRKVRQPSRGAANLGQSPFSQRETGAPAGIADVVFLMPPKTTSSR